MLRSVLRGARTVTREWPDDPEVRSRLERPRHDLLTEDVAPDGTFRQVTGPFRTYERTLTERSGRLVERTRYQLAIPWFGWLFAIPVRLFLGRRIHPARG